jgi:uncharacterized protein (UPF0332 family)
MSFSWKEYLNLAKELSGVSCPKPDIEAVSRTAISRAYYSVFHRALFYIEKTGDDIEKRDGIHLGVKKWFFKKGEISENIRLIGVDFDRLRMARVEADYIEPSSKCNIKKAIRVIEDSENLIKRIDSFLTI